MAKSAVNEADAVTCTNSVHCYAYERLTKAVVENDVRIKTTNMSIGGICTKTASVEQWVTMPNGDWVEMGQKVGGFIGDPCATTVKGFHASAVAGIYDDVNDGSVTVGTSYDYYLWDVFLDMDWYFYKNGVPQGSAVTTNYVAAQRATVGSETSTNTLTIPSTDISNIKWWTSDTTSAFWTSASSTKEDAPPLWWKNCTPNYQHIRVGSGTEPTGTC
jgi:hypothetical protein